MCRTTNKWPSKPLYNYNRLATPNSVHKSFEPDMLIMSPLQQKTRRELIKNETDNHDYAVFRHQSSSPEPQKLEHADGVNVSFTSTSMAVPREQKYYTSEQR